MKLPANGGKYINDYSITMDIKIDALPKERLAVYLFSFRSFSLIELTYYLYAAFLYSKPIMLISKVKAKRTLTRVVGFFPSVNCCTLTIS